MRKDKLTTDVEKVAKRVYRELGAGHEEAIYRDAMSIELQEFGYTVKTEMPATIPYKTSRGKELIVGSAKVDLFITKQKSSAIIELKAVSVLLKEGGKKTKEDTKEYAQLLKYLNAIGQDRGILINFPFPPERQPEIIF